MNTKQVEKGQVLVIFSLVLVVMLGFIALAVDGSMIYSDRRYAQNAADASALAGVNAATQLMASNQTYWWNDFNCNAIQPLKDAAVAKANLRGLDNKYTLSEQNLNSTNHGIEVFCQNAPYEKYLFVRVKITSTVTTGFAHLFYSGPIMNTVEAVARVKPRMPLAFGNAIIALDNNCSYDGVNLDGGVDVNVYDGGIFSNSCMTKNGISGNIYVPDSTVTYNTTFSGHGDNPPFLAAKPTLANIIYALPTLPVIDCTKVPDFRGTTPTTNMVPGRYNGMTGDRYLAPGLYCFYGDISLAGEHDVFHGNNVTLYFVNGGLKITGQGDIQLSAPAIANPVGFAERDIVILMAPNNTSDLVLEGNSNSYFEGLILAPNQSIDLGGCNSSEAYRAQVIGRNVKYHGDTDVNVTYFNSERFMTPVVLDMAK